MVRRVQSFWQRRPVLAWSVVGVLSLAVIMAMVVPALAATTSLTVTGNSARSSSSWTRTGGTDWADAMNTDNGDTSYAAIVGKNQNLYLDMSNPSLSGTINSVTVYAKVRQTTGDETFFLGMSDGTTDVLDTTGYTPGTSYPGTPYSWSRTLAPDGTSWDWTDINNLQLMIRSDGNKGWDGEERVTYVYAVVDYTAAAPDTITLGSANQPSAAYVGQSDVESVDGFTLQRTSGSGSPVVSAVTITNTGSTPSSNISAVRVYRDDGDNVYDAGDTALNATAATFSGTTASVSFDSNETVTGTSVQYWVVYTVAGGATNAATMNSRISAATHTATTLTNNAVVGNTFTVDAAAPAVNTSDPSTSDVLTAATQYSVTGTASDGGSGVASVEVQIQRSSDNYYWNGATWQSGAAWNAATGTTNWSYTWSFSPTGQNGSPSYSITARADDNVGNTGTDSTPSSNITIDNTGPTVVSATPVSSTVVDVVFSEALASGTIATGDFSFAPGLGAISSAVLQGDNVTVRLTHATDQTPGGSYTVTVTSGSIDDVAGNGNQGAPDNDASFTGYGEALTATSANQPAAAWVTQGDTDVVVDGFTLQRTAGAGSVSVSAVTIRDTGTVPSSNISGVYVWLDDGDNTFDIGDTQLNTAAATFSGTDALVTFDSAETVGAATVQFWVTYDIAGAATNGATANSILQTVSHDAELLTNNTITGSTYTVDAADPTANTSDPSDDDVLTAANSYSITGSAGDVGGSGVASVDVQIQRSSDSRYWRDSDSSWQVAPQWNSATGTTAWSYSWDFDPTGQDGSPAYTITARATDNVGNTGTDATPSSNITIDNTGPTVVSAVAVSETVVDVVFSEALASGTIGTGDFSFAPGLGAISSAVLQGDNVTVRLTHATDQTPGQSYTVTVTSGSIDDVAGNGNQGAPDNDASFTGYGTLTVTLAAASADQPAAATVVRSETDVWVDGFTLQRTSGTSTVAVSGVTVNDGGTAPSSNVSGVYVWLDDGDDAFDAGDTKLNATAATFTGADAVVTFDSNQTIDATARKYWVTYDVHASATHNATMDSRITGVSEDADALDLTGVSRGSVFTVDAQGPTVVSATAVDSTHVDVLFSEDLDGTSLATGDFAIDGGLTVTGYALQPDGRTVRLTNGSDQTDGFSYTVTVTLGAVDDVHGNGNVAPNTAGFTGVAPADGDAPSVPVNIAASAGTTAPIIAVVTWDASTDNVGVTGYRIWRSTSETGTYVAIDTIVATASPTYVDESGVPGQTYYYKASAYDAAANESARSVFAGPVTVTWSRSPHATYGADTDLCDSCHATHQPATQENLFRDTGAGAGELSVCYACHDGTGANANVKNGAMNSFALSSGHSLEATSTSPDLTNECSSCHSPHKDYIGRPNLWRSDVNSDTVSSSGAEWCLACHNDAQDWYDGAYPGTSSPSRDASGYPATGTYPGETTYVSAATNAHSKIPTTAPDESFGDCRHCHGSHRETNAWDMLEETFRPATSGTVLADRTNGTYADSCFVCHGGVVPSGFATAPVDIKQFVTFDGANDTANSGHRIKTGGGTLPIGAPLPCYDCHNPHGSANGNDSLLSDELGGSLNTASATAVRQFCFTCHTTSDTSEGWDSGTTAYVSVTGDTVEGLERDGSDGSVLLLPAINGHTKAVAQSCYTCHGLDYSLASSSNVHNPGPGKSGGGSGCYTCHGIYQSPMEDSAGSKTGANNTDSYHHVMGGAAGDGDIAPKATPYPTSQQDVYCVSCHTDHNYFNPARGSNLRQDIANTDGSVNTNTDFLTSGSYGICLSCHGTVKNKDTLNQKDDGTTTTQRISGVVYDSSTHDYSIETTFGTGAGSSFYANCSKCHDDEQTTTFQTGSNGFGTHFSATRRIVSAFGGTVTDPVEEEHCYGCHSRNDDAVAVPKPVNGKDWYGSLGANMTLAAEYTYEIFNDLGGSSHPVSATVTGSVECENCHNPHTVNTAIKVSDPDNTYDPMSHGTIPDQVAFCMACHDGAPPAYQSNATTYVPETVVIAPVDVPLVNKATHQARGHWTANGSIGSGEETACWTCHDNHGSNAPKLLGQYDPDNGQNWIGTTSISSNNNNVCSDSGCHGSASTGFPVPSYDASGYPQHGTWPGMTTYNTAYVPSTHTGSIHSTTTAVWPGTSYAGGDCKNCHDVHGSANLADALRTEDASDTDGVYGFAPDDMTLCFNCHDADGPATGDIKRYYPATSGGTNAGERAGHQIQTSGGNLSPGMGLPCYDCHNPHGSASAYGLQVTVEWSAGTTSTFGDAGGEISLSDAAGIREFCFLCHTTSDTSKGFDGSGYTDATGTFFEGLSRTAGVLMLPNVSGHNESDTASCYQCHGNNYSGATTNNVHNPSGGVSTGGTDCYECHGEYQTYMEDDVGSKQGGPERLTAYHHVMGTPTNDGDTAFADGSYPTGSQDLFCLSCHVDHDQFNSNKAFNLRASKDLSATVSNTDRLICLNGCHAITFKTKDLANQKDDGFSTGTPSLPAIYYNQSSHQYTIDSTFSDGSVFQADCSKCHNDSTTKEFQTGTYRFGTHWVDERRLLTAFGAVVSDPMGEEHCFGCHSRAADGYKSTNGWDAFETSGAATALPEEKTYTAFGLAGSTHPVTAGTGSVECVNCHNVHAVNATGRRVAQPDSTTFAQAYATDADQSAFCLVCHDGTTPTRSHNPTYVPADVTITPANAASMDKDEASSTAHWTANGSIGAAETVSCPECHDKHGSNAPDLLGVYDPTDDTNYIGTTAITANNNTVCQACHNGASTSFPAGEAQRDGSTGYLADGTWPGMTRYNTAYSPTAKTGSFHTTTTAVWPGTSLSGGDCKNCHDVHGTDNSWDALRTDDSGGTDGVYGFAADDVTFCLNCHDAGGPASTNISQFMSAGGHEIKTAGGNLPVGSVLPCYDCHNPHGSASTYGLQVREFGDASGEIDIEARGASRNAASVREFCLLCHSTWDGMVWDPASGASGAYVAVGTDSVEGLRRDGTGSNVLKIPNVTGHDSGDSQSCTQCHGEDYAGATSANVHNPSAGVSSGGDACYTCHTTYQNYMEDDSGSKTGSNNASAYHHVLGGSSGDGDIAPNTGAYPTSETDVYCVSCHTDHNYFNATPGSNLRQDIATAGSNIANSDFSTSSPYGICVSCHDTTKTKQGLGTELKNDGQTIRTPEIDGSAYDSSRHQYAVATEYGSGNTFNADCSKCHSDEQAKDFATADPAFGTHWSANRSILTTLGQTPADDYGEQFCFRCHSWSSDVLGGDEKPDDNADWFGSGTGAAMDAAAQAVWRSFNRSGGSKHPVVAAGGNNVECENCHNPHEVAGTANTVASDPDNIYNSHDYDTTANQVAFCLTCHDDTTNLPTYTLSASPGGTWIPNTVTIAVADQALMDKDGYTGEAHWTAHDSISSAEVVSCPECHDQHGSTAPKLLGVYDAATDTNKIGSTTITGNNNTACTDALCHGTDSTSYPPDESDRDAATGYLTNGTYPGNTVYSTAYNDTAHTGNGHTDTAAVWPGTSYIGGDCKNCHNVHGTDNAWDALVTGGGTYGYAQDDMSFCFNCHDGSPAATDIMQYYPSAVGGDAAAGETRSGHRVLSNVAGATLAQNEAVPCYDCHNPHGGSNSEPYMLEANGVNDFNDASTDAGMARFCFACHVPSNTSNGWNGTTFASAAGAEVEGISRTNASYKLKLPTLPEHTQANGSNCLDCHSNPHNPTGGVSNGGVDCYACHGDYQQYMEDNTGTDTGSNRTTYYHHVLGSSSYDGDESDSFYSGSNYPAAGTDVYCLSCHVDHDKFNSAKGSNLRADMTSNPSASNTDYSSTSPYGVCISCHSSVQAKDTTHQNSSYGSAQTAAMSGADYNLSPHSYDVASSFSGSTFNANCVKCHSDFTNETTDYQADTGNQFALHYSAESRILNAFGATVPATDQLEEDFCFECHSTTSNAYAASNRDAYNDPDGAMDDDALAIEGLMASGATSHPVSATNGVHKPDEGTSSNWNPSTNRHVECEDCHNPHEATDGITGWPDNTAASAANVRGNSAPAIAGANKGVWGVTITGSSGGDWNGGTNTFGSPSAPTYTRTSEASYQWELCLKCHGSYGWGSSPPNVSVNLQGQTGGKQTDVGTDFSPDNYAIHPIFDSGKNQPPTNANSQWNTNSGRRNIGGTTSGNGISNTLTDGWEADSRVVCTDCHNNAVTSGASGPHASDNEWLLAGVDANIKVTTQGDGVLYPNANYATNGQGANFCVNCHRGDVYGSEAPDAATQGISYGDLSRYDHSSMNDSCGQANNLSTLLDYSGCLNCHGARKDTSSYSNPANTVVQSGAIHGTSMGDGPGNGYSDPMGYRFRNGASWASQGMGDSSGSGGCQNFNGSGAPSADNYSSCTKHGTRSFTPEYYYARPTS